MAWHTKYTLYGKFIANLSLWSLPRLVPTKQHNSYAWHTIVTQSQQLQNKSSNVEQNNKFCLLPSLLYMFSWWWFTWYNLLKSVVTNTTPAPCWLSSISNSTIIQSTLMNEHQQWTHIHVASLAIVCSDAIPQAISDYLVLPFWNDTNTFHVHNRQHRV